MKYRPYRQVSKTISLALMVLAIPIAATASPELSPQNRALVVAEHTTTPPTASMPTPTATKPTIETLSALTPEANVILRPDTLSRSGPITVGNIRYARADWAAYARCVIGFGGSAALAGPAGIWTIITKYPWVWQACKRFVTS
jgi:hypothetical protein